MPCGQLLIGLFLPLEFILHEENMILYMKGLHSFIAGSVACISIGRDEAKRSLDFRILLPL